MAKRTWFQHDFNCSEKEKFSALIANGGMEAYGQFWIFAELWYSMQLHKSEYKETLRIHSRTLMKAWGKNNRSLDKVMQLFSDTLGIVWVKLDETYGKVYETTWSNSLNYIENRNSKTDNKSKEKESKTKESKLYTKKDSPLLDNTILDYTKEDNTKVNNTKILYLDNVFLEKAEYEKLIERYTFRITERAIEILDSYLENNSKKKKEYKNHYKVIINWVAEKARKEIEIKDKFSTTSNKKKDLSQYRDITNYDAKISKPIMQKEAKKIFTGLKLKGIS